MIRSFAGLVLLLAAVGLVAAQDKKEKDKAPEKRSGTLTGVVTDKDKEDRWVEVKADGEEKARRYVPHWVGGAPKDGGGPNKDTIKAIKEVKVKDRVRLEWEFEERPRVVKIEVLKKSDKKGKKDK